jgi:hypothetical protein
MTANSEVPANASAATDNRNPAFILTPALRENVEPLQVADRNTLTPQAADGVAPVCDGRPRSFFNATRAA